MSEHELWNELGNLYFLSGAYDQAILAYNKSLQLESNFAKPYSNLALVYSKQKKYNDAVSLYKKSLELLTDERQKAETWNRLGNVYRALKDYQEAIFAFKKADELQSVVAPDDVLSEPIPYNNSETGQPVYEVQENQQDYQYNAIEYLHGIELEFDETIQTPARVTAEIAVENNYYGQNVQMQAATKSVTQSELEFQDEISTENMSDIVSNNHATDEDQLVESETQLSATSVEQDLPDIDHRNLDLDDSELELQDEISEESMSDIVSNNDATDEDYLVESETKLSATPVKQDLPDIDHRNLDLDDSELELQDEISEESMSDIVSNNDAAGEDHLADSEIEFSATPVKQDLSEIDDSNPDFEDSEFKFQDEISEESMSDIVSNNDATEEDHLADSEIEFSATPVEQDLSEIDERNLDFEDIESESLQNTQVSDEFQEILPDEITPKYSEKGIDPDEDVSEEDSEYEEPITQAQENVESSLVDLSLSIQQVDPAPDISASEKDLEILNSNTSAKDESDTQIQNNSNLNLSVKETEHAEIVELDRTEMDICVEEKKLARQIEINPRSATTWEALGTLYKTAGRYKEAIQAFEQAIAIKPYEVSLFHNLGLVYAAQGNNQEAFNTFQKVLELDPNHSLTHASLGGYYKKIGLDELAQKHIGKAMKQIYESENEYNRACLDAICGNYDQAINLLRFALENEQTYVDWVLSDPDLDPLREDERFKQLVADFSR